MISHVRRIAPALALIVSWILSGPAAAENARPIIVFAAASLQGALNAAADQWGRENGRRIVFSFAGTPALARQIEQGAPADIFAAADSEWMDWVEARGLVRAGSRRSILGNRLVLIAPRDQPSDLRIGPGFPLDRALGGSRLAIANPQSVPAGRYAQQALTAMGVWDEIRGRVVGADNVRAALALVARGEVRFGVVYETDARSEARVLVVDRFPGTSHAPVVYPFAVTTQSADPDAERLLAYLASPAAAPVFQAEGFLVPGQEP